MSVPTAALTQFRRRGLETPEEDVLAACFVLEPHMAVTAGVVASFQPAAVLQILGGAKRTSDATVAETIEHAVEKLGVRTVVVCAEGTLPPEMTPRREQLLASAQFLTEHPWLGRLFREHEVAVEALWLDVVEGDIHVWEPERRAFELLADDGLGALLTRIQRRAGRLDA